MKKGFKDSSQRSPILFMNIVFAIFVVLSGCSTFSPENLKKMGDSLTKSLKVETIVEDLDVSSETPLTFIVPNDENINEIHFQRGLRQNHCITKLLKNAC